MLSNYHFSLFFALLSEKKGILIISSFSRFKSLLQARAIEIAQVHVQAQVVWTLVLVVPVQVAQSLVSPDQVVKVCLSNVLQPVFFSPLCRMYDLSQ